ncbi:MAG: zinc ribbon domain-containing protein [Planctomycetes bacterium]|nr:zinc ribbon domain-containing protein [Planctomycetota bacterium]
MPTYEYQCKRCGHRFSEFQRIVDPPIKDCPKCKKKDCVEQIISGGSGLIFKGSGFYITDYARKSSGKSEASAGSDSAKPTESSKEAKKD